MRVKRDNDVLVIVWNLMEARFFDQLLERITASYRAEPGTLHSSAEEVLYSTKGCAAETTPEEAVEWAEQLRGFKSARLSLIDDWSSQLKSGGPLRVHLEVKIDHAPEFIGAINDYRLMAAAEHAIGEDEMSFRDPSEMASLPDERQGALLEIHFLAWIMEESLRALETS